MDRDLIIELAKEFGISQNNIKRDISNDTFCLAKTDSMSLSISNSSIEGTKLELAYRYRKNYWVGVIEYKSTAKNTALKFQQALRNNACTLAPKPSLFRKPAKIKVSVGGCEAIIELNKV